MTTTNKNPFTFTGEPIRRMMLAQSPKTSYEGLITDNTIRMLKQMFSTPDKYKYYLDTLVVMRKLMIENISYDGLNVDENHELFPILKTVNEFIGVIEGGRDRELMPISGLMLYR